MEKILTILSMIAGTAFSTAFCLAPVWRVACRDRYIGWDESERKKGLSRIANNMSYPNKNKIQTFGFYEIFTGTISTSTAFNKSSVMENQSACFSGLAGQIWTSSCVTGKLC